MFDQLDTFLSLDCHIVGVDVLGPGSDDNRFSVKTVRSNPAKSGVVTGSATYASFLSSMIGEHLLFFTGC